jgi:fumarate hydratase subunit beta
MTLREHYLTLPLTPEAMRELRVGDLVWLTGEIHATAGLPTHDRLLRCLDGTEQVPFDMTGGALFHLGSLNEEESDGSPRIRYINPTTSTRFNAHMPRLIPGLGLRATGGKGGLDAACARAMAQNGCIYLSFLGGGAPIITDAIRRITGIGWPEMISHYRIVRVEVEQLGPLTVGIDASGASIYDTTRNAALSRRETILSEMRVAREGADAR